MKKVIYILCIIILFGCAKVSVEATKPIKVDISMRVDIYQHVVKDVKSINDQIYGGEKDFNAIFIFQNAYAADLSLEASQAISRRKARVSKIEEYFSKGYIGENRGALLQIRGDVPSNIKGEVQNLINDENKDRKIIYTETANKNEADVSQITKVFFQEDYKRAPKGYWFEVYNEANGQFNWVQK